LTIWRPSRKILKANKKRISLPAQKDALNTDGRP
jgi:hypothetical protein